MTQNKKTKIIKEVILLKQSQLTSKICNNIINNKDTLPTLEKIIGLRKLLDILKIISNNSAINKIYLT